MKKFLLTIAAVLTAAFSYGQTELLTNGGFEDGVETGWTPTAYAAAKNATVSESTDAHTGSKAALVAGSTKNVRLAASDLQLKAGTYTMTAYVKAATEDGAAARLGYVIITDGKAGSYNYSVNQNGFNNADTLTTEWKQLTYNFTLTTTSTVNILVMNSKNLGKDLIVDDCSLTTTDGGISNGGDDDEPTTVTGSDYEAALTDAQGSWTFENVTIPDDLSYVWQQSTTYGMKASAYKNSTKYVTESYLVSPAIVLEAGKTSVLTFDHVARYFNDAATELTLWVRENGATDWATQLTIPTYSDGSSWTYVSSGDINLSAYAGKTIQLGWRYTSSEDAAATWELKNVKVTNASAAEKEPELKDPTNTPATAYTIAQAKEIINNKADYNMSKNVYVAGTISEISDVSWDASGETYYGNATYYIATGADTIEVYRGYDLQNQKFTAEDAIKVGDNVIVYGKLTLYGTTYEIGSGNYIYSLNGDTARVVAKAVETPVITVSDDYTVTITCATEGAEIYYSVNAEDPDENMYSTPFSLGTEPGTYTIQAIALKDNDRSDIATATATIKGTVQRISLADFLAKADTINTYEVTGVVSTIKSATYGNFTLVDGDASIYIYGTLDLEGNAKNFESLGVQEGDSIVLQGVYLDYNGTAEIKNAQYVSHKSNGQVVVDITNTIETAYTATEANAIIAKGEGLSTKVYVKGTVMSDNLAVSTQYGNATYYITDGTENIEVFRGYGVNGNKFTAEDELQAGDEVIIYGQLVNYNGTYEVTTGSQIVKLVRNGQDITPVNSIMADTQKAVIYDLQGRRVANAQKGIFIVNGKKVVR